VVSQHPAGKFGRYGPAAIDQRDFRLGDLGQVVDLRLLQELLVLAAERCGRWSIDEYKR